MAIPFYERLPKDDFIDEIHLRTVPRYKTSDLSGSEWRTSVEVVAYRKGREVGRQTWNRLAYALLRLGPWIEDDLLFPVDDPHIAEDLCFQPGCKEPGTVEYRIVTEGCSSCGHRTPTDDRITELRRRFCEAHAKRGDQSVVDSDDNYAPINGPPPAEHIVPDDAVSPSAFGGSIYLTPDDRGGTDG